MTDGKDGRDGRDGTEGPDGPSQYVKLNVGGSLFYTTQATLTKCDSLLSELVAGERPDAPRDSEGCLIIDRCGKHFGTILNYLRDGSVPPPESRKDASELFAEAQHYRVDGLAALCRQILTKEEQNAELICRVPLVTSSKEAHLLISSTKKPVVKLLFNRHNNKYSYTNSSDDNLLKNLELFDRLSLRFSGRILFIKDVDELSQEICFWSFYKCGKSVATICCTSNVNESEKMYTKVDFPETKISEETDTIMRNKITVNNVNNVKK